MLKRILVILVVLLISLFVIWRVAKSQSTALIELNSDYSWNWINGSPTPVVITTTPRPTQTPWIITATPSDVPTQEILTPTFTPSSTPTSDACYGITLVKLNLRDDYPRAEDDSLGNVIGSWEAGTRLFISDQQLVFYRNDPLRVDYWYEVMSIDGTKRGWSAGIFNKTTYIDIEPSQVCLDLFGDGVHILTGGGANAVAPFRLPFPVG